MLVVTFWTSLDAEVLAHLCEALVCQNVIQLRKARERGLQLPRLYDNSQVVYRRDPPGAETFRPLALVYQRQRTRYGEWLRWGDCDDLAALLAAEARFYDHVAATVAIQRQSPTLLHALVRYPDGALDDPSARLIAREKAAAP